MAQAKLRGPRRRMAEEEDASILRLGEEFQTQQCLMISEVRMILEAQLQSKEQDGDRKEVSQVRQKSLAYVQRFSKFNNRDSVREVRTLFTTYNELPEDENNRHLEQFEIAQIINLGPDEADEAKILIPSLLQKIDDDRLQELLNQMSTIKKFQGQT